MCRAVGKPGRRASPRAAGDLCRMKRTFRPLRGVKRIRSNGLLSKRDFSSVAGPARLALLRNARG
ncbi:hypothetical protein X997_5593 [Burkholderia pseudomallei A79C]|nr:hypothetical protein X997_5593 [Burkholderia pseudomallei A79C]